MSSIHLFLTNKKKGDQLMGAEEHLTKLMAAGLSPFGIRVNAICPGKLPFPLHVLRAGVTKLRPTGLFHSNLTTDAQGNLYPPMQASLANIPKG